ncbi:MAG: AAA-like domain-containing protein, partial [Anaerolineae bacterium]|nr:AAA-like domain-containing protein [Anaerolineae bacterium]
TFVLLGVARPADLIKDRSRTPYNIGTSVDLTDFTWEEARTLLPGLQAAAGERAEAVLRRILHWTGGHPYLTQKVCAAVAAENDGAWTEERTDRVVERLFFSDEARKESNLQYIGDRIRHSADREKMLRIYRQVLSGRQVADDERDPAKSQLKLTGLIKVSPQGMLCVRNHIYETFFNTDWVRLAMPKVTAARVAVISVAVALLALIMGGFLLARQQSKDEIQARTYIEGFGSSESAAVRINNLAGLFRLDKEYADQARALFFGLNTDQQLALFTDLTSPEQVDRDDLQGVIRGLYTHLEDTEQHNKLLKAMRDVTNTGSRLHEVIDFWLKGRTTAKAGRHEEAIAQYDQAIKYGEDVVQYGKDAVKYKNPAIYRDRALAYAHLEKYGKALDDLSQVVSLDATRRQQVVELIRSDPALSAYLAGHKDDFSALSNVVSQ